MPKTLVFTVFSAPHPLIKGVEAHRINYPEAAKYTKFHKVRGSKVCFPGRF